MRKKVKEFAVAMTAETTLAEIWSVCKTPEEIRYVLGQGERLLESAPRKKLSISLRVRALQAFQDTPAHDITTLLVQKRLSIGYGSAVQVKHWLLERRLGSSAK